MKLYYILYSTGHSTCILKNPNECQTMLDQHHWNVGVDNLDYQYREYAVLNIIHSTDIEEFS